MRRVEFAKAEIGQSEMDAVNEVMKSGWLTSGKMMRDLETRFREYHGADAIAVNSATSGLHLALEACGVKPGDEVIIPTWTFTATAEVVRYLGATPVMVDVDPRTLCMTWKGVFEALTDKTVAIVPVHFAGYVAPMKEIWALAQDQGLYVIEDAAHALGSEYYGSKVGSCQYSDACVFSFYATKCITTAEGGMVMTNTQSLADRMRVMRLHGISRDAFDRYQKANSWEYDVVAPGFKYNMPDVLAAIGLVQFGKFHEMQCIREMIAMEYMTEMGDLGLGLPAYSSHQQHSWHLFVLQLPMGVNRAKFISDMADRGVVCSVHFKPLHQMTCWRDDEKGKFSNADLVYSRCVSLPIYSDMQRADVVQVIAAVRECLSLTRMPFSPCLDGSSTSVSIQ